MNFFDIDFFKDIITTLIGILIGIPAGLILDRLIERKKRETSKIEDFNNKISKQLDLLELIKENFIQIRKNKDKIEEGIKSQKLIFLDFTLLESTATIKYEIVENIKLNRQIDSVRYDLKYLQKNIDFHQGIFYSGSHAQDFFIHTIVTSGIKIDLENAFDRLFGDNNSTIDKALKSIDLEIVKLNSRMKK